MYVTDESLLPEKQEPLIITAAPFGPVWLPRPGAAAGLRGEVAGDIEHPLGVVLAVDDQGRHPYRSFARAGDVRSPSHRPPCRRWTRRAPVARPSGRSAP